MYGLFLKILYQERAKLHKKSSEEYLKSKYSTEQIKTMMENKAKYYNEYPLSDFKDRFQDPYLDFIYNDIACDSEVFKNNMFIPII